MKSVHLTNDMLEGLMRLAVQEQWSDEIVRDRIKQFSIATSLNGGVALTHDRVLELVKDHAVDSRRKSFKIV